jgi:hypothetical protein
MKSCNICHQSKDPADFPVRRKSLDGLSYTCRLCARERTARWKQAHPHAHAAWYQENREHKRKYFAAWRAENTERCRENVARQYAMRFHAAPMWADPTAMRGIYQEAARLMRETGIRHDVDHIVPLRSPLVCGLHVPANLQILTSTENKKKANRFHASISS